MSTILTKDLMNSYLEARKSRIPVAEQTSHQRAGRFLLLSAARTENGKEQSRMALHLALDAGEIEASLTLTETMEAPSVDSEGSWKGAPGPKEERGSYQVSGAFDVDFSV